MTLLRPPQSEFRLEVKQAHQGLYWNDLVVEMGSIAFFEAMYNKFEEPTLLASHLFVRPDHRGAGIGEALVRRMVFEASRRKLDSISSKIVSQYALDIRGRIFGKESLRIEHEEGNVEIDFPLAPLPGPVSFDDARAWLEEAEQYEQEEEKTDGAKGTRYRRNGFTVLASFDDYIE